MIDICFVCTGNTCRSFMAERIAKKMAKARKMTDIKFSSAGVRAKGDMSTENACKALKALGYDGRKRKSVLLKKTKPDCIYITATNDHKPFVDAKNVMSFEDLAGKVIDPYGQDLETYVTSAKLIEQNVKLLLDKIQSMRGGA